MLLPAEEAISSLFFSHPAGECAHLRSWACASSAESHPLGHRCLNTWWAAHRPLRPLWHGGIKHLSPALGSLVLYLCSLTTASSMCWLQSSARGFLIQRGHTIRQVWGISTASHSLHSLFWLKRAGFSLLSVSERGSEKTAASLEGMVKSQQKWSVLRWNCQGWPRMSSHIFQNQV